MTDGVQAERFQTVHLLADEPADGDEFDAKAHQAVANAIVDLVRNEPGGRVIGLEGPWGSGKSSIVKMVCQALPNAANSSTETCAVVFDTWAHERDPLRRTFLESLIAELRRLDWMDKPVADGFLGRLSGRTSSVRTKTTSRLSLEGSLAAVAAVFLPLGNALFDNKFASFHRPGQIAGALLLVGPMLVVAAFTVAMGVGRLAGGREKPVGSWQRGLADLNPLGFFAKDQATDTTTEGIQSGEPTSVEFAQLFDEILTETLQNERRLLLILDNLDRIETSHARSVLATMQTFTGSSGRQSREWSDNVWTLIPYDPEGLARLWSAAGDGNAEPGDDATHSTAAAFVEKVFEVRFDTPPLVLSDWRGHLLRLLEAALPGRDEAELRSVTRLRALYPGVTNEGGVWEEGPTPRQLKQFVNQIGAVVRQRADVSLINMAYFVLLRRDQIDVPEELLAGRLPHAKLAHLFDAKVRDDLAALHFGTTQSLAQQLLLGGVLEGALARADAQFIGQLKDLPGFFDAVDSLDLVSRAADGGVELTRAVAVFNAAETHAQTSIEGWFRGVVEPLATRTPTWVLAGRETGQGLAILFDRCADDDVQLGQFLAKVLPSAAEADENGQLQLDGVAGLLDELLIRGRYPDAVRVRIDIPLDRLVAGLAHFKHAVQETGSLACLDLAAGPAEVSRALMAGAIGEGGKSVVEAFDSLMTRPERIDLGALETAAAEWLRENEPSGPDQLSTLLDLVDRVRGESDHDGFLGELADDGTLMHFVSVAHTHGWHGSAASASMLHLTARPQFVEPAATRDSAAGALLLRQLVADPSRQVEVVAAQQAWLEAHRDEATGLLFDIAYKDTSFRPWVDHQVKALFEADALEVSASLLLRGWRYLDSVLGTDGVDKLATPLVRVSSSRNDLLRGSVDPAFALRIIDLTDTNSEEQVGAWAADIVKAAPTADWTAALSQPGGGSLITLALRLASRKASDPIGLSDALHVHFKALAAGEEFWQPEAAEFLRLVGTLKPQSRHVLASQLCAELEGVDHALGRALFTTYGDFLAAEKTFRTHAKLPNVVDRLVAHEDWASIDWLVGLGKSKKDTFDAAGRDAEMRHLRDRVESRRTELGDDCPQSLIDLAAGLSIE